MTFRKTRFAALMLIVMLLVALTVITLGNIEKNAEIEELQGQLYEAQSDSGNMAYYIEMLEMELEREQNK